MPTGRGTVISVHLNGATVRLDDGSLASVPFAELAAHRPAYVTSLQTRTPLDLALERSGRHCAAFLATGGAARLAAPKASGDCVTPASDAVAPGVTARVTARGSESTGIAPLAKDVTGANEDDSLEAAELEDDLEDGEIVRTLRLVDGSPLQGDPLFEHRIAAYLKQTEEWAPTDRPAPDERNETRKKKRKAFFESRPAKRQPPT